MPPRPTIPTSSVIACSPDPSALTIITLAALPECCWVVSKTSRLPSGDQSASPTWVPHGTIRWALAPSMSATHSETASPAYFRLVSFPPRKKA